MCLAVLPSNISPTVPTLTVWVPLVVDLETERVLQVIARLLSGQTGHHGGPVSDVFHHHTTRLRQPLSRTTEPAGGRHPMTARA
jgi:hypothetical protein